MLTMRKPERTPAREQNAAQISAHVPARARFHFIDDAAIERLPPPEWLIDDLLPARALGVLYAPPESAKTFFSLGLALTVASGKEFFGRRVKRGSVVYVAAEGSSGLPVRVNAWKHSQEFFGVAGVQFLTEPVQLLDAGDVGTFLASIDTLSAAPALIVIDTLHWCMAGGDENSAKDMGIALHALGELRRATNATILAVHHTRVDGERERGSTSLRGAADAMLALKREGDRVTVTCEKQKDAPHFAPFTLELAKVQRSCALITAGEGSAVTALIPGDPRHAALRLLHDSTVEGEGLSTSVWLKASGMKDRTFYAARKQLITLGCVESAGRKKGAPNTITAKGKNVITANCNVTA
jgi:hypothetical protein